MIKKTVKAVKPIAKPYKKSPNADVTGFSSAGYPAPKVNTGRVIKKKK